MVFHAKPSVEIMLDELKSIRSELDVLKKKQADRIENCLKIQEKFSDFHIGNGDFQGDAPSENWNSLPDHLKLKCLENLDLPSKIHVAMTCKAENALVEMHIFSAPWKCVILTAQNHNLTIRAQNSDGFEFHKQFGIFENDKKSIKNSVACISHLFKSGPVENFGISESETNIDFPEKFYKELGKIPELKIQKIYANPGISSIFSIFLKKSIKFVEKLRIEGEIPADLSIFRQISTIKNVQFDFFAPSDQIFVEIIRSWIKNDAPIGTRMLFDLQSIHSFGDTVRRQLAKELNGTEFRIRKGGEGAATVRNNKRKSILIRDESVGSADFVSCVIIPTTLKASKYEKAADWMWDAKEMFV